MKKIYPVGRKDDVVVQELDGEILIYDLKVNKAFCLNETSALVWDLCDGENSITEISNELSKKLKSPANEDLVWFAIDQLKKENLIETQTIGNSPLEGMTRREVVRKVGLGTMIALPLISSLLAPTSVAASSACTAQQSVCSFFPATVCCPGDRCQGGATPRCCSQMSNGLILNGNSAGTVGGADAVTCRPPLADRCCSGIISNASYMFTGLNPGNPQFFCTGDCAAAP